MLPAVPGWKDQLLLTWPFALNIRVGGAVLAAENEEAVCMLTMRLLQLNKAVSLVADSCVELGLGQAVVHNLAGQDEARGLFGRGFEFLLRHQHDGRLNRGEDDCQERQPDHAIFHCRHAAIVTRERARQPQPL